MTPDPFDLFWQWANKPTDSDLTLDADIHEAVMALTPEERMDRSVVNEAVRKMNDVVERVARAIGDALAKGDGRFEVEWPYIMCNDANAGCDLRDVARSAIDEALSERGPLRPAGSADQYGVPRAEE